MAVRNGKERRKIGDIAVDEALGSDPLYGVMVQRTQRKRAMSQTQRKEAKRAAKRNKATYDLPEAITEAVSGLAAEIGCPPAHVVMVLLDHGLKAVEQGELRLRDYRTASPSPRYDWFLELMTDENEES